MTPSPTTPPPAPVDYQDLIARLRAGTGWTAEDTAAMGEAASALAALLEERGRLQTWAETRNGYPFGLEKAEGYVAAQGDVQQMLLGESARVGSSDAPKESSPGPAR